MKDKSIWSRTVETAVCQIRNGWVLIPITVALSISVQRIGLLTSCLVVLAIVCLILIRKYRITVLPRNDV